MRSYYGLLLGVCLAGCWGGPSRVKVPYVDAESAAEEALNLYDSDNDGSLSAAELARCPGMLSERAAYDSDGNGTITGGEIAERIAALRKYGVGLTRLQCDVRLNGRPLENAIVEFVPEPYLGGEVQPAQGTTNKRGLAHMSIAPDHLPSGQPGLKAIHFGTYKVRITHPKVVLPPRYNTDTTLGYETRAGDPFASFALKAP